MLSNTRMHKIGVCVVAATFKNPEEMRVMKAKTENSTEKWRSSIFSIFKLRSEF